MENNISKNNHFVPQFYLRNWSTDGRSLFAYRTLVSHAKVPYWSKSSIVHLASHQHLYTVTVNDEPSDFYEKWFNVSYETPAQPAIEKVLADSHLTTEDYKLLIHFLAIQMVRTPSWFIFLRKQMERLFPNILNSTVANLEQTIRTGKLITLSQPPKESERFSIHTKIIPSANAKQSLLKADIYVGQKMWLKQIEFMLPKIITVLMQHSWRILKAAPDYSFPTSDDPVVCMGYRGKNDYWFNGVGINQKNADIFIPLSPKHILFTEVGNKNRSSQINSNQSALFQEIIIKHAHRYVFSSSIIKHMSILHPRTVNEKLFIAEHEAWDKWLQSQRSSEQL